MSEIQVLPIEHWVSAPFDEGSRVFLRPFGPETPEPQQYNPNVAPPELVYQPRQRDGVDFLRYLASSNDGDDVLVDLILTESRQPYDLGPADGEFEEAVADPETLMVIYGLAGSVAQRQAGLWTPPGAAEYPTGYVARLHAAATGPDPRNVEPDEGPSDPGVSLASCDPQQDIMGQPVGPAERAIADMAGKVLELGFDPTDTGGQTQLGMDVAYVDKLHWVQIPEVGQILMAQRRISGPLRGIVKIFLPAESLDVARKFDIIGFPGVEPSFATAGAAHDRSLAYEECMRVGGIPA